MTLALSGEELAVKLGQQFSGSIVKSDNNSLYVKGETLLGLTSFLKNEPGYEFDFLSSITAVDYKDHFEVIYQLTSLKNNHSLVLKTRCDDRDNAVLPSLVGLWRGADFQEREVYDLFGIRFEGHPYLKRIFMWEGYKGHPLRKDFTGGNQD